MGEISSNTNLASEYYVLSCLYRIGADAYLTLGNKKSVDIIVKKPHRLITIDVKGLKGTTNFPIDNWTESSENHYLVFVTYNDKITDTTILPDVYIVPSMEIETAYDELKGRSMVYVNPKGNRKVVELGRLKKLADRYKNNWHPFL